MFRYRRCRTIRSMMLESAAAARLVCPAVGRLYNALSSQGSSVHARRRRRVVCSPPCRGRDLPRPVVSVSLPDHS